MFNVDVRWEKHAAMPLQIIAEHRDSHDFPGLLAALAPQTLDKPWGVYEQIQAAHLARTQVSLSNTRACAADVQPVARYYWRPRHGSVPACA